MKEPTKRDIERRIDKLEVDEINVLCLAKYAQHLEEHGEEAASPGEYFGTDNWGVCEVSGWREDVSELLEYFDELDDLTYPEYYAMKYKNAERRFFSVVA